MCGKFSYLDPHSHPIHQDLGLLVDEGEVSRFNITPGHSIVVAIHGGYRPGRGIPVDRKFARFGFLPGWAKEGLKPSINARGETVATLPMFRDAFRHTRCLIPASGWYEPRQEGTRKVPYYFQRPDKKGFFFAGLYAGRNLGDGGVSYTFCIITTAPSPDLAHIHPRQPVVIPEGAWRTWLDDTTPSEQLLAMLKAWPKGTFECWPVSPFVNQRGAEGPDCITLSSPEPPPEDLFS